MEDMRMDKQQTLYYEFIPTGEAKMKIDPKKQHF